MHLRPLPFLILFCVLRLRLIVVSLALVLVVGCSFGGGYRGDGAPAHRMNPKAIADAVPRPEQRSRGGNKSPYRVLGKTYHVMPSADGYRQRGTASWYGTKFHGNPTSNGERYDMYEMTAAHKSLPIPTYVRVRNLDNGREVIVRVNDRGPFHGGRIIDLSYAAATKIGMLKTGTARVEVEAIDAVAWQRQQRASRYVKKSVEQRPLQPSTGLTATAPVRKKVKAVAVDPDRGPALSAAQRMYLQVGAYSKLSAAQGVQNKLLDKLGYAFDYNVVIHPTANDSPLYRVRIGPLPSQDALLSLRQHVALNTFSGLVKVLE